MDLSQFLSQVRALADSIGRHPYPSPDGVSDWADRLLNESGLAEFGPDPAAARLLERLDPTSMRPELVVGPPTDPGRVDEPGFAVARGLAELTMLRFRSGEMIFTGALGRISSTLLRGAERIASDASRFAGPVEASELPVLDERELRILRRVAAAGHSLFLLDVSLVTGYSKTTCRKKIERLCGLGLLARTSARSGVAATGAGREVLDRLPGST